MRADEKEEEKAEAFASREAGADADAAQNVERERASTVDFPAVAALQQQRDTLFAQTLSQEEELKALRASLSRAQARADAADERAGLP